ncbi:DUF5709 domain-containing protein [Isoptericola sp. b441]|uniref:DUF5709 domain-containing protein n=1 Tax=Actinotalea lenta TaxID=3064654 RepID=A0ABT9D5V3_9CELL|nr:MULTISPECIES: DUF5709 domain-containing protein [unclassified Isoptericola]MDO8105696.1 DUF5709 domain-containing protein [Isoptericola sp. b441]MDO8122401.1 DUF5709 domain-containing protein [Isoptericola sp. b490]
MSSDTPGTRPEPEGVAEGDTDQLTKEDELVQRGVDDLADEGWSPPDRPNRHLETTEAEELAGDSLDERLTQEEPEEGTAPDPAREPGRVGRLASASSDAEGESSWSTAAVDEGVAGGAASAEEAAMHLDDDEL